MQPTPVITPVFVLLSDNDIQLHMYILYIFITANPTDDSSQCDILFVHEGYAMFTLSVPRGIHVNTLITTNQFKQQVKYLFLFHLFHWYKFYLNLPMSTFSVSVNYLPALATVIITTCPIEPISQCPKKPFFRLDLDYNNHFFCSLRSRNKHARLYLYIDLSCEHFYHA